MRILITASFLIICGIAHAGSPLVLYCTASEATADGWGAIILSDTPPVTGAFDSGSRKGILVTYLDNSAADSYYQKKEYLQYKESSARTHRYISTLTNSMQKTQIDYIDAPQGRVDSIKVCNRNKSCMRYDCSQMRFIYPFDTPDFQ